MLSRLILKNKKVFISMPMNGKTDEEIVAQMNKDKQFLEEKFNCKIIDTYINESPDPNKVGNPGIWYLAKSIEKLASADVLYMAKGADKSRGCMFEEKVAMEYGIPVLHYFDIVRFGNELNGVPNLTDLKV